MIIKHCCLRIKHPDPILVIIESYRVAKNPKAELPSLKHAERTTRRGIEHKQTRLLLSLHNSSTLELLLKLFYYSKDGEIFSKIRTRLTQRQYYGECFPCELKSVIDIVVLFPEWYSRQVYRDKIIDLKASPETLYIIFVGRLTEDKNVLLYFEVIKKLFALGIKFEAHIFGPLDPTYTTTINNFWSLSNDYKSELFNLIKYHGRYNSEYIRARLIELKSTGSPIALFSKGLVTKELVISGVPIITTSRGNYDLLSIDHDILESIGLPELVEIDRLIKKLELYTVKINYKKITSKALVYQEIVQKKFNLKKWGDKIINELRGLSPAIQSIVVYGPNSINAPHGPVVWSSNFIKYLQFYQKHIQGHYICPTNPVRGDSCSGVPKVFSTLQEFSKHLINIIDAIIEIQNNSITDSVLLLALNAFFWLSDLSDTKYLFRNTFVINKVLNHFNKIKIKTNFEFYKNTILLNNDENSDFQIRALKIESLVKQMSTSTLRANICISNLDRSGLVGLKNKFRFGTHLIHVDHALATNDSILIKLKNNTYDQTEIDWFRGLIKLLKIAVYKYLDRYIALWPANVELAHKTWDIPIDKILYIPTGVYSPLDDKLIIP